MEYISEKEQVESILKWWKETGKYIAMAVIIGLLMGFAWRYWHTLERHRAENASALYQSVLVADKNNTLSTVQAGTKLLKTDFSNSPYASLAALLSAKEWVAQNQLPQALTELQWVIDHANVARLKEMARINAARILLSQQKDQAALAELHTTNDKTFMPLVDWVTGDIYLQMHQKTEAQHYYQKAYDAFASIPEAAAFLQRQLSY